MKVLIALACLLSVASCDPLTYIIRHSDAEADCHIEMETITTQECLPHFEIKCEEHQIKQDKIVFKKVCQPIVDVICGNDKPVVPKPVPSPYPYHKCFNVKRDHCYVMPVIEEDERPGDKCHVVQKAECKDVTHQVPRHVCKHDDEVEQQEEESNSVEDAQPETYAVRPLAFYYPRF